MYKTNIKGQRNKYTCISKPMEREKEHGKTPKTIKLSEDKKKKEAKENQDKQKAENKMADIQIHVE